MEKEYIEVKIPVLGDVEEMEVVKTFNQRQLWYVCAIAKAYEKTETQLKKQKEINKKAIEYIKGIDFNYLEETYQNSTKEYLEEVLQILEDKGE